MVGHKLVKGRVKATVLQLTRLDRCVCVLKGYELITNELLVRQQLLNGHSLDTQTAKTTIVL